MLLDRYTYLKFASDFDWFTGLPNVVCDWLEWLHWIGLSDTQLKTALLFNFFMLMIMSLPPYFTIVTGSLAFLLTRA